MYIIVFSGRERTHQNTSGIQETADIEDEFWDDISSQHVSPMQYLWGLVTGSSRAERLSCAGAVTALVLCSVLVVYYAVIVNKADPMADNAPHEWNITREDWLAEPYNLSRSIPPAFEPLRLVIIHHSVSPECNRFMTCAAEMRNIQTHYLTSPGLGYDIPYNFVIGNDGRVYEGRGWNIEGAHTKTYNRCSLGIGFIGDYRDNNVNTKVTDLQVLRTNMLLDAGVKYGYLHPDYAIVGARDLKATESPGINLYNIIREWDHYDTKYIGLTCQDIFWSTGGTKRQK